MRPPMRRGLLRAPAEEAPRDAHPVLIGLRRMCTPVQVMRVVRALVARGITICATIHCPPPHTFTLFDRALIMQRGRVVYFGPNGQPSIDYFYEHFEKVAAPSLPSCPRCARPPGWPPA